jgi:hypothetical protein
MKVDEKFCPSCGSDRDVEIRIAAAAPALESARKWILGIGIWYLVGSALFVLVLGDGMMSRQRDLILISAAALCVIHIGLWFWARTQPFPAAVVAAVIFATLLAVQAVTSPADLFGGIIIKIAFAAVLYKAVQAGLEAQRLRGKRG